MSLEECEKFYLEEFRKLLFSNTYKYPDILKSKDIDNFYYYIYQWGLKNTHAINYPLMIPNEDKTDLIRFYKILQPGDKVLIWNDQFAVGHLTAQIITKDGYIFSLGTFSGVSFDSLLSTPDFRFEKSLIKQVLKPRSNNTKLIAISELNNKHIRLLNNIFDSITITNDKKYSEIVLERLVNIFIRVDNEYKKTVSEINEKNIKILQQNNNENGSEYKKQLLQYLTKPKYSQYFYIVFPFFAYNWTQQRFCVLSRKGGKTVNCASFIESIFGDIITCTGSKIITIPGFCKQSKTAKHIDCSRKTKSTTNS